MFLLCKDDVTKEDRTFTLNYPFIITLTKRLYTFAAFPKQELAEYFKTMLKLEDDYKTVDISVIEKEKLKESRYLYVFSTKGDINRLLSDKEKGRCRNENVVEIAKIRSNYD